MSFGKKYFCEIVKIEILEKCETSCEDRRQTIENQITCNFLTGELNERA